MPQFAAAVDDVINYAGVRLLKRRGWRPKVIGLTGYGSTSSLHVFGRVVMHNPAREAAIAAPATPLSLAILRQRGWRSYFSSQVPHLPVRVRAGGAVVRTATDRGGYVDVLLRDHGLPPGWHEVTIEAKAAEPTQVRVLIVGPDVRTGIVSDIDDTIMVTMLPRAFLAAWNTFVRHSSARKPVPGMAALYRRILADHPDAPVFYLSTGAWNAVPILRAFMRRHGYPQGPMLMTDWGPTATSLFRSGVEHKRTRLRDLLITFPEIKWVLVGDDGQHDPMVYDDLAREHAQHVAAVAIRQLTPAEQVLSHGTPESLEVPDPDRNATSEHGVPVVLGRDGVELLQALPAAIAARKYDGDDGAP